MPSFLSPLFLVGALAAAIPVVLHLLKRNPEPRVKFAAVALLRHAPVEHSSRRRLRQIVLLMLRVAALLLLALAFARPFFPSAGATAAAAATIVALDTSFSLSAPGRFARAQELAREAVTQAPAGNDVAVVTFSDRADLVQPLSSDRALARAAIDRATPGFGSTRYLAALNMAGQSLAGRRGTIVVVTDLQETGWDAGDQASVSESARVEIRDVGALPGNLAVVGVRAEGDRVAVTVRNAGNQTREARVRLTIDGRSKGETSVSIGPERSADAVFSDVSGIEAVASVEDREGLQADNARYALLERSTRTAVLAVTATGDLDREAFYVQQALATGGSGSGILAVADMAGVAAAQLTGWSDTRLAGYGAVLVLSTRGLERRGRELLASYVAGGGGLLIAAGPDVDGDVVAGVFGAGTRLQMAAAPDGARQDESLAPADIRHPIFQPFGPAAASLGLVTFSRAARISGTGCQTLAKFTSGDPAVIDCGSGQGRAVVVASDLNNRWNDFPRHATFVPFLHETVRYLSRAGSGGAEYLVGEVPAGVPPAPGIVTLRDGSQTRPRRVAVNVDPRESEPSRITADAFQSAVARLKDAGAVEARVVAADQESRQHIWQYLLAVMLVALALEGVVASRTV
jgi:hypothetical protein